jgi:hypothetical protein
MRKRTPLRTAPTSIAAARLAHVSAGVRNSDPSDANRVIERHELPGNQGG